MKTYAHITEEAGRLFEAREIPEHAQVTLLACTVEALVAIANELHRLADEQARTALAVANRGGR